MSYKIEETQFQARKFTCVTFSYNRKATFQASKIYPMLHVSRIKSPSFSTMKSKTRRKSYKIDHSQNLFSA